MDLALKIIDNLWMYAPPPGEGVKLRDALGGAPGPGRYWITEGGRYKTAAYPHRDGEGVITPGVYAPKNFVADWAQEMCEDLGGVPEGTLHFVALVYDSRGPGDEEWDGDPARVADWARRLMGAWQPPYPAMLARLAGYRPDITPMVHVGGQAPITGAFYKLTEDLSGHGGADFVDFVSALSGVADMIRCPGIYHAGKGKHLVAETALSNNRLEARLGPLELEVRAGNKRWDEKYPVVALGPAKATTALEGGADRGKATWENTEMGFYVRGIVGALAAGGVVPAAPPMEMRRARLYMASAIPVSYPVVYCTSLLYPRTHFKRFFLDEATTTAVKRGKARIKYKAPNGVVGSVLFGREYRKGEKEAAGVPADAEGPMYIYTAEISEADLEGIRSFKKDLRRLMEDAARSWDLVRQMVSGVDWGVPGGGAGVPGDHLKPVDQGTLSKNHSKGAAGAATEKAIVPRYYCGDEGLAWGCARVLAAALGTKACYAAGDGRGGYRVEELGGGVPTDAAAFSGYYVPASGMEVVNGAGEPGKFAAMSLSPLRAGTAGASRTDRPHSFKPAGIPGKGVVWVTDEIAAGQKDFYRAARGGMDKAGVLIEGTPRTLAQARPGAHAYGTEEMWDMGNDEMARSLSDPDPVIHLRVAERLLGARIFVITKEGVLWPRYAGKANWRPPTGNEPAIALYRYPHEGEWKYLPLYNAEPARAAGGRIVDMAGARSLTMPTEVAVEMWKWGAPRASVGMTMGGYGAGLPPTEEGEGPLGNVGELGILGLIRSGATGHVRGVVLEGRPAELAEWASPGEMGGMGRRGGAASGGGGTERAAFYFAAGGDPPAAPIWEGPPPDSPKTRALLGRAGWEDAGAGLLVSPTGEAWMHARDAQTPETSHKRPTSLALSLCRACLVHAPGVDGAAAAAEVMEGLRSARIWVPRGKYAGGPEVVAPHRFAPVEAGNARPGLRVYDGDQSRAENVARLIREYIPRGGLPQEQEPAFAEWVAAEAAFIAEEAARGDPVTIGDVPYLAGVLGPDCRAAAAPLPGPPRTAFSRSGYEYCVARLEAYEKRAPLLPVLDLTGAANNSDFENHQNFVYRTASGAVLVAERVPYLEGEGERKKQAHGRLLAEMEEAQREAEAEAEAGGGGPDPQKCLRAGARIVKGAANLRAYSVHEDVAFLFATQQDEDQSSWYRIRAYASGGDVAHYLEEQNGE